MHVDATDATDLVIVLHITDNQCGCLFHATNVMPASTRVAAGLWSTLSAGTDICHSRPGQHCELPQLRNIQMAAVQRSQQNATHMFQINWCIIGEP
jgi:hypothetical protein